LDINNHKDLCLDHRDSLEGVVIHIVQYNTYQKEVLPIILFRNIGLNLILTQAN